MLDIIILGIGKIKEKYYDDAVNEYLKRLKPYARISILELRAESFNKNSSRCVNSTGFTKSALLYLY